MAFELKAAHFKVRSNVIVRDYLRALVATGLYGNSVEEAAERLVCERLERLIADGFIPRRKL